MKLAEKFSCTICMQLDAANATCARLRHDLEVSRSRERELQSSTQALQKSEKVRYMPCTHGTPVAYHASLRLAQLKAWPGMCLSIGACLQACMFLPAQQHLYMQSSVLPAHHVLGKVVHPRSVLHRSIHEWQHVQKQGTHTAMLVWGKA